jgi:hypothetical protein
MRILTVSQVREHLYWGAGGPSSSGSGAASLALLGRIFHELYGVLTGPNERVNLTRPLELADGTLESWSRSLVDHAFAVVIAPALAQYEALLQSNGPEVLSFWQAARELCAWVASIMHDLRATTAERSLESWRREVFTDSEVDLSIELTDPAWPEAVQLQGRADAILRRPGSKQRCLIELKLGRGNPTADLLQGCLYHLILTQRDPSLSDTALGLVSFEPSRHDQLFEGAALKEAQAALRAVLAELAGFDVKSPPKGATTTTGSAIAPAPADYVEAMRRKLTSAFAEYGAPLSIADDCHCGPALIRFFATPQRGVRVKSIATLASSVWMRLGTSKPPQVSLDTGRVVIDVERADRQPVKFVDWRSIIHSRTAGRSGAFPVGVRVDGTLHVADLAESQSPHLLVVGTTGSGKSEWLRAFLASLMAINTPQTLRLALIDPKRVAFSLLEGSAFLWQPVVYDQGAIELLDQLMEEMETRYRMLQDSGVDDLATYNSQRGPQARPCPRIICVCDEFADLVTRERSTRTAVEQRVSRLGAKGRAAGVHLVFATQKAGREVLKGTIDSNLPGRVALTVQSDIDSRMVLREGGAEDLLGKGDLLYKDIGSPVRLQALLVTKEELQRLARKTAASSNCERHGTTA